MAHYKYSFVKQSASPLVPLLTPIPLPKKEDIETGLGIVTGKHKSVANVWEPDQADKDVIGGYLNDFVNGKDVNQWGSEGKGPNAQFTNYLYFLSNNWDHKMDLSRIQWSTDPKKFQEQLARFNQLGTQISDHYRANPSKTFGYGLGDPDVQKRLEENMGHIAVNSALPAIAGHIKANPNIALELGGAYDYDKASVDFANAVKSGSQIDPRTAFMVTSRAQRDPEYKKALINNFGIDAMSLDELGKLSKANPSLGEFNLDTLVSDNMPTPEAYQMLYEMSISGNMPSDFSADGLEKWQQEYGTSTTDALRKDLSEKAKSHIKQKAASDWGWAISNARQLTQLGVQTGSLPKWVGTMADDKMLFWGALIGIPALTLIGLPLAVSAFVNKDGKQPASKQQDRDHTQVVLPITTSYWRA